MELRVFLESLGFNWRGYRKKQRGVRSRLYARVAALDLVDLSAYREVVLADENEQHTLHAILGISVTRLFRDLQDWELLRSVVLEPWLISPTPIVRRAWSMGCASGEEPYTLHMVWRDLIDRGGRTGDLEILATEIRLDLIERARRVVFPSSALRHIPEDLARRYVRVRDDGDIELSRQVTSGVEIQRHDYLLDPWPEDFDLILARNGIFTYRNREDQDRFLERLADALRPDGHLFVGSHDIVPDTITKRFDRVGRTLWRLRGDDPQRSEMMSADELGLPPVFWEVHQDLPRQGPGNNACTRRALEALEPLPRDARIVDVGCGPGMQTLELVRLSGGRVIALDRHRPFLHELRDRAAQAGLSDRIATALGDMSALPFAPGSVDLFWAEGAVYIMGFETGLRAWRPLLRNEGYVAVTEITWLKLDPPEPLARFWQENYPALASIEENVRRVEAAGYRLLDHFTLPPEAWWDDYYTPIEARLPEMRNRYAEDPDALTALDAEAQEIDLFRRYSDYYGYVFYVLQNTGV